jgi:hypothetical protein
MTKPKRIHIIALVLLHHLFWLSREILVPICTPKPEGMLILAPVQNG